MATGMQRSETVSKKTNFFANGEVFFLTYFLIGGYLVCQTIPIQVATVRFWRRSKDFIGKINIMEG